MRTRNLNLPDRMDTEQISEQKPKMITCNYCDCEHELSEMTMTYWKNVKTGYACPVCLVEVKQTIETLIKK